MFDITSSSSSITSTLDPTQAYKKVLFVTGRAGTGKSTLLKKLCAETKKRYVVLAPTGIAAVNVKGETIHSFFKFKPGITEEEALRAGERNKNKMYERLELLIIDEISMVRADLMDCIDSFLRAARKNEAPFGGVQVVLFGDLYQLEPIVTGAEKDALFKVYDSPYFFSSRIFQEILNYPYEQYIELIEMTKVFRQSDDYFISVLDNIRKKKVTDEELYTLNRNVADYLDFSQDDRIYLTSTNAKAAQINSLNQDKLNGEPESFIGTLEGNFSEKILPTEWTVQLKVNSRIMMLNNDIDGRWINGTLGVITGVDKDTLTVLLDDGKEHVVNRYTWNNYKYTYNQSTDKIIKEVVGSFTQFPVKLAWAITIHKSQGQTFDNVVICLGDKAFAHGQTYVALSRCRTLEGIILERPVQHWDIMVDDKVTTFLRELKKYVISWRLPKEDKKTLIEEALEQGVGLSLKYIVDDETIEYTVLPQRIINGGGESILYAVNKDTSEEIQFDLDYIVSLQLANPQNLLS